MFGFVVFSSSIWYMGDTEHNLEVRCQHFYFSIESIKEIVD